jgi:carbon storage regulator
MLVLTRKVGEKILIGNDITLTVVEIGKSRVKLGIEAPASRHILRSELVVELEQPSMTGGSGIAFMQTEIRSTRPSSSRRADRAAEPQSV